MKLLPEHAKYKKYYVALIFAAYFLYLISIAIKMVYSAQLVEIGPYFGVNKSKLSLGLTLYYIIYSTAQFVISPFLKRLNISKFLAVTVLLSGLSFIFIKFCTELWQVYVILSLNGIFQVGVYSGCMDVFAKYLPDYISASVTNILSSGMAIGTALAYGFSFLFVEFFAWQDTFVFFGILTIISIVCFYIVEQNVEKNVPKISIEIKKTEKKTTTSKGLVFFLILFLSCMSMVSCISYYGLSNWVPNLLKEVHGVPSQYSILITLLVPLGVLFGPFLASGMCKKQNNYFLVGLLFSLLGLLFSILLFFFYDSNLLIAILISISTMFFVRGFINLITSYIPLRLRNLFDTGTTAMIINATACVAAAVTPFITALIADNFGWRALFLFICLSCVVWVVITLIATIWSKKNNIFNKPQV